MYWFYIFEISLDLLNSQKKSGLIKHTNLNLNYNYISLSPAQFVVILIVLVILEVLAVGFLWVFQTSLLINVDKTFDKLWNDQPVPIKPGNQSQIASLERWVSWDETYKRWGCPIRPFHAIYFSWIAAAMWGPRTTFCPRIVATTARVTNWILKDAGKSSWTLSPIVGRHLIWFPWCYWVWRWVESYWELDDVQ